MGEHEKSKKHVKNVQALKRQMVKEHKEFDLDRDVRGIEKQQEDEEAPIETSEHEELEELEELEVTKSDIPHDILNKNLQKLDLTPSKDQETKSSNPESDLKATPALPASTPETEEEDETDRNPLPNSLNPSPPPSPSSSIPPKMGKAKQKRAKKAAKQAAVPGEITCVSCGEKFLSKTKMFNHLQEFPEHAKPVAGGGGKGKGKGRGKGKK